MNEKELQERGRVRYFRFYGYPNESSATAVRYLRGRGCMGRQIVINCIEQCNAARRFARGHLLPEPCGERSGIRILVLEGNDRRGHKAKRRVKKMWEHKHQRSERDPLFAQLQRMMR